MIIIGIDPGLSGGIAVLDNNTIIFQAKTGANGLELWKTDTDCDSTKNGPPCSLSTEHSSLPPSLPLPTHRLEPWRPSDMGGCCY